MLCKAWANSLEPTKKRVFDLCSVLLALTGLSLPLLLLAWAVRRKLGSPVFFRQVRPGITGWAQVNGKSLLDCEP